MKKIFIFLCLALCTIGARAQNNAIEIAPKKEIHTKHKIKVFPNPATNVVNVLGLLNSNRAKIVISDSYGNTLLQHNWAIKNKAISIPIAQLNSGVYIISITSKEQKVQEKFFKK